MTVSNRAMITVPEEDVQRLDELATTHRIPNAFGRAVEALARELNHGDLSDLRYQARYLIGKLRVMLGLEPLAALLEPPPAQLDAEQRREIQEAIWELGEDLATSEPIEDDA